MKSFKADYTKTGVSVAFVLVLREGVFRKLPTKSFEIFSASFSV